MQHCAATKQKDQEMHFCGIDGTKTIELIDNRVKAFVLHICVTHLHDIMEP